jgi:iron complex outermembrane receptor protein
LSAPSNFKISDNLKFDTIPYFWYGYGNGGGVTTMSNGGMYWGDLKITNVNWGNLGTAINSSNSSNKYLYYNPSITETYRPGVIDKFTYDWGDHQIVAGHWFEYASHKQTGPFEALNADGSVPDVWGNSGTISLPSTAVCQQYDTATKKYDITVTCPTGAMQKRDQLTSTMTNVLFIGDTWKATDRLTLIYGVKQAFVNRQVEDYMPGANPGSMSLYDTATLPTFGGRFKLDSQNTLFANFATSFRSAPNYTLAQSFSSTTGVIGPGGIIPPEEGKTVELGHRYQGPMFSTSVTGFGGYYKNYQVGTYTADPGGSSSTVPVTIDVGDVINFGVDAEIGTRRFWGFRAYASGELLRTEMLDNAIQSNTTINGVNDYLVTAGKQLPGAPNYSGGIGIDYDDGHIFGNIAYKYMGPQFSTFVNDEQMKAFGRMDVAIGYRFDDLWGMKKPEIKLNVFNVLDARELTGIYTIENNTNNTVGVNGHTIAGYAPNYYMGQPISFMLTFRVGL